MMLHGVSIFKSHQGTRAAGTAHTGTRGVRARVDLQEQRAKQIRVAIPIRQHDCDTLRATLACVGPGGTRGERRDITAAAKHNTATDAPACAGSAREKSAGFVICDACRRTQTINDIVVHGAIQCHTHHHCLQPPCADLAVAINWIDGSVRIPMAAIARVKLCAAAAPPHEL